MAKIKDTMSRKRRGWNIFFIVYIFITLVCFIWPMPSRGGATEAPDSNRGILLENAKKEGTVVFYSTKTAEENNAIINGFQKRYPSIKVGVYRSSAENLLTKILMEVQAKRHEGDVYSISGLQVIVLKNKGLLMKYYPSELDAYPPHYKDPEGYWVSMVSNTYVLSYNTKLVLPQHIPKSYEDLLNARWKGAIGLDREEYEWFATMLEYWGRDKGLEFMRKLSNQGLQFRKGHSLLTQLIIAGEIPIGLSYGWSVENAKSKGAQIDWVKTVPTVANLGPIAIAAHPAHPSAAKLFYDWVLSREGQETLRKFNRIPCREDMEPDPPSLTKGVQLVPSNIVSLASRYAEITKEFDQIFLKK